ncbi:MAG: DUF1349 domain-containing protein, partial [Verrucomicrobia bacterium]|nr:DUF1349 domain-containing protein [Verrucomicrobiota bacterium]
SGGTVQLDTDNSLAGFNPGVLPVTLNVGGTLTGLATADGGAGTSTHFHDLLTLNGGTLAMGGTQVNTRYGTWDLDFGVAVNGGTNTSTISALDVIPSESGGTIFNVSRGGAPGGVDLNVTGTLINGSSLHDTGIIKTGNGVMALANTNSYAGDTVISNGVLALVGNGSISNQAQIEIGGGATFDVSDVSNAPYDILSGQTLTGLGGAGTIAGSLDMSLGAALEVDYTNGTPTLTVTNGTLTLSNNPVTLIVEGATPLTGGRYKLVSVQTGGLVAGSVASSSLTVGGAGLNVGSAAISLQISGGELYLVVDTPPAIANVVTNYVTYGTGWHMSITNLESLAGWSDADGETLSLSGIGAAIGTATVTIAGTDGTLTHTTGINLTITAPGPDFSLSASPSSLTVAQGTNGTSAITINPIAGFNGTVSLSASGLPSGVTVSFNPSSATNGSTLTLSASGTAAAGTSIITITGTSGSLTNSTSISLTIAASGGGLPSGWTDADIGSVGLVGSASYSNGTFTVSGSGADIWNAGDQCHYAYQSVSGDQTVIARVVSESSSVSYAKAGVMIRETLDTNSVEASVLLTPTNGVSLQVRPTTGANSINVSGWIRNILPPQWVKLVRSGNTFTGSYSTNGSTWTQIGSTSVTMATNATAGLAVSSHDNTSLNTATFDNVSVAGQNPDFSLSASPGSLTIVQGANGTSTITVNPIGGYSGTVSLSASGLPSGVTASFNPASTTNSSTLTLTASAASSVLGTNVTYDSRYIYYNGVLTAGDHFTYTISDGTYSTTGTIYLEVT